MLLVAYYFRFSFNLSYFIMLSYYSKEHDRECSPAWNTRNNLEKL